MATSTISSSLTPGGALFHVNVPTLDQATVAVAQVREALYSMHVSSQSMRARPATSSNHVNNDAMLAYRLMTESSETQEVVARAIPTIQAALARKGDAAGDSHALETAKVITGLVVLVTAVIVVGTVLVL